MAGNLVLGYFMGKGDIEVESHGQSGPRATHDPRQKPPNIVSTDSAKESPSCFLQGRQRLLCAPNSYPFIINWLFIVSLDCWDVPG